MFAYNIGILKKADRLEAARREIDALAERCEALRAPHAHELLRLKETEAMLLAAAIHARRLAVSHRIPAQPLSRGP